MLKYHILKIIQTFVFPPGIFIVFLFLASLFAKKYKKLFLFLTFISYLLSIQVIGNLLLKPLEDPYKKKFIHQNNIDMVVVLGGGYYKGSPNLPLGGGALKRAIYGYEIAKKEKLDLLYNGTRDESKCAKLTYKELFPNVKNIFYENQALSTKENAFYTKKFFLKRGIKHPKIYLVTSAFHMRRAKELFEKSGIKVIPAATDFRLSSNTFCHCFFAPSDEGFDLTNLALHEYVALIIEFLSQFKSK